MTSAERASIASFALGGSYATRRPYEAAKTAAAYASIFIGAKGYSIWTHPAGTVTLEIPNYPVTTFTLGK
jgi:hypothetical protein